jgi:Tfp pilus assembly protein PilO
MAGEGVLADFARMPTQRKVMVFVVIGALLGLVYWKFVYKTLADDLEAAQVEHDNKVQTNQRLAADIPKFQELLVHVNKLKELIEKNQTALPSEAELPAFIETLQHKVTESGVETRKWTYRTPELVETFVKVPFEVEVAGTFMQIKRFFASLVQRDIRLAQGDDDRSEEHDRIVSIENLSLSGPTVRNRDIILSAKFTAVTFRQEDRPPDAAGGAPAGAPPGAAAPPRPPSPAAPVAPPAPMPSQTPGGPAGGAPPPMPSAASPAGAKARVEQSIEKGDARNRNGESKATGSDRLKGGI